MKSTFISLWIKSRSLTHFSRGNPRYVLRASSFSHESSRPWLICFYVISLERGPKQLDFWLFISILCLTIYISKKYWDLNPQHQRCITLSLPIELTMGWWRWVCMVIINLSLTLTVTMCTCTGLANKSGNENQWRVLQHLYRGRKGKNLGLTMDHDPWINPFQECTSKRIFSHNNMKSFSIGRNRKQASLSLKVGGAIKCLERKNVRIFFLLNRII